MASNCKTGSKGDGHPCYVDVKYSVDRWLHNTRAANRCCRLHRTRGSGPRRITRALARIRSTPDSTTSEVGHKDEHHHKMDIVTQLPLEYATSKHDIAKLRLSWP